MKNNRILNFEKCFPQRFHQQVENFTESADPLSKRNSSTALLTVRQFETLEIIRKYVEKYHISPSLREIANEMRIRTINGVRCHLEALERKGYLYPRGNRSRSIALKTDSQEEETGIPIRGGISRCRLRHEKRGRSLALTSGRFYGHENYFVLQFRDDSLQQEYDFRVGDCLVIRKTRNISIDELVFVTDRSQEVFLVNYRGNSEEGFPVFRSYGTESREISIVEPKIHGIIEMQIRFLNPRATLLDPPEDPGDNL
ncbi:MAG: hypothetical protein IJF17_06900 [Thermoguttaceae bacterium]|nr:hypothetical protein [Thermoguttaceae bacterium]